MPKTPTMYEMRTSKAIHSPIHSTQSNANTLYKNNPFDNEIAVKVKRNYGYHKDKYDVEILKTTNIITREDIDDAIQEAIDFNMD
jgi:hypothetical protein